ncbi:HNH endonuclease [Vibrio harveyi]
MIEEAFAQYDAGKRPQNYGKPGHWYVLSDSNGIYPAKIIWALANGISDTTEFHSKYAREQFSRFGFRLFDNRDSEQNDFDEKIKNSLSTSSEARRKRLAKANKKPQFVLGLVTKFKRNPDVVAEVLVRAGEYCEGCSKKAPFQRKKDRSPYLEVHHIVPLAKGGDDTVENAIALCPNCHREAHFG